MPGMGKPSPFRSLPSVEALRRRVWEEGFDHLSDEALTKLLRDGLARERRRIAAGEVDDAEAIVARVLGGLTAMERPRLSGVINATGVIIHTNLGRSPVSPETAASMAEAAGNAVALEIDPETNARGGRMREISDLMRILTGAEATLVVNNNAAAILLVLSAVAAGRSVVLSRGEAVEIGGGFRVPDVMRQSGARLVEVGTTNRTYARDYAAAIDASTAALLKVHPSNFVITGFTHATSVADLAPVAQEAGIPLIEDQGSGALLETAAYGLAPEPTVTASLQAGATVVTASGDKLLGGPQAGLIVGEQAWVQRIERHPLARAMRADKTCLAGVAATLRHYVRGDAVERIPVWRMLAAPETHVRERAEALQGALASDGLASDVITVQSTVGGGSLPGQTLPSVALGLCVPEGESLDDLARRLRTGRPGVFGRIEGRRLLLDLRTVLPEQDDVLAEAVRVALVPGGRNG